jgi:CRISPR/Cas system-associated endonuclease Cas1
MKVKILRAKIKKLKQEEASLLQYNLLLNKKIFVATFDENGDAFFVFSPEAEKELKQKISKILEKVEDEREEEYETLIARRFSPERTNQTKTINERLKLSNSKNP